MSFARTPLRPGDILTLGASSYVIESVVGCGSSSVAYRAHYKDELNTDSKHNVLIKELFPIHPKGEIYRGEDNSIVCTPEAADFFEFHKERFRQGNKINLDLLEKFPDEVAGNLNSYECFGTYYSVLTSHGGESLDERIENGRIANLREAAELIIMILHSLGCFHDNGMLHLDVSPDNVLILGQRALLIDFNSTWSMDGDNERGFAFSEKEGYSPPEVTLREISDIGFSTDLYSVCAVFYRMVAGKRPGDERMSEKTLRAALSEKLPLFSGQYKTAVYKAVRILLKGLHLLPRKRYASVRELENEFRELIERIDNKGVSKSALWEVSRLQMAKAVEKDKAYLEQKIRSDKGVIGTRELLGELACGKNYLLHGVGGIGKTRFLHEIWKSGTARFNAASPTVFYIPLKMYQESADEKHFLRSSICRSLNFSDSASSTDDVIHELDKIFEGGNNESVNVLLLLDGLNEAGKNTEGLLKEIESLGRLDGVGILLTDRTADVKAYGLEGFDTIKAEPLEKDVVTGALETEGADIPKDEKMLSLLTNPMMLMLYTDAYAMNREATEERVTIKTADELIGFYMDTLVTHQQRVYTGDEKLQLQNKYILRHLLPEIAYAMQKKSSNILTRKELLPLAKRNYDALKKRSFGKNFAEYLGKSRFILEGISTESEWFDFALREVLCDETGLVVKYDSDRYSLIHDNFIDTLASAAKPIERYYSQEKTKSNIKKVCIATVAVVAVAIAVIAGASVVRMNSETEIVYTEEEMKLMKEVGGVITANVGSLGQTISHMNGVLESTTTGVLINEERSNMGLEERIKQAFEHIDDYIPTGRDTRLEQKIAAQFPDFPIDEFAKLCEMPIQLRREIVPILTNYGAMLCDDDTLYTRSDLRERKKLLYENYVKAYDHLVYNRLVYTLMFMPQQTRLEVSNAVGLYIGTFDAQNNELKLPESKEVGLQNIKTAEDNLEEAMEALEQEGFFDDTFAEQRE